MLPRYLAHRHLDWTRPTFRNGALRPIDGLRIASMLLKQYPVDLPGDVSSFEEHLKKYIGARHAYALGAGRMALYVILKVLDFANGDEIIVPGYTCVVVPNAIRFAGCTPVYADIERGSFNIDPKSVQQRITSRTKAIIAQHTYGIPADLDALQRICEQHGLALIDDGAHALGATFKGRPVGKWGDVAFFSLQATKMITTEHGGVLCTDDDAIAEKIRRTVEELGVGNERFERFAACRILYTLLKTEPYWRPFSRRLWRLLDVLMRQCSCSDDWQAMFDFDREGKTLEGDGIRMRDYPVRLSGVLCSIGEIQLDRLDRDIQERARKAEMLAAILVELGAEVPRVDRTVCSPSWLRFPFLVDRIEQWSAALAAAGWPVERWFSEPLYQGSPRAYRLNSYVWGSCPNAEYVCRHVLNLPVNHTVSWSKLRNLRNIRV